jgi:hypothetical protein
MGFFSDLFKKGEDPVATYNDPQLGLMSWSEDEEGWVGEYKQKRLASRTNATVPHR